MEPLLPGQSIICIRLSFDEIPKETPFALFSPTFLHEIIRDIREKVDNVKQRIVMRKHNKNIISAIGILEILNSCVCVICVKADAVSRR